MPFSKFILNLPFLSIEKIEGEAVTQIYARYTGEIECPFCSSKALHAKAKFTRKVRHGSLNGNRPVYLLIPGKKYRCLSCQRYFRQRFPGILPYKRSSESFRREVFRQHYNGVCQKVLAKDYSIGSATVERWYHDFLDFKFRKIQYQHCPQIMGIDEHFFSRRTGFATTFCDIRNRRIFDITLGRSEQSLSGYLSSLTGRNRVRIVVMDLAETYRSLVRRYFPRARIVADRFHIIRLINHHFLKVWQVLEPLGRKNRGLLSLMRRKKENLSETQHQRLMQYLNTHPVLFHAYHFKQNLCWLMNRKRLRVRQCLGRLKQLTRYIQYLKESPFETFKTLADTLESWKVEIVHMWFYNRSNGITEGFHNKMKMIQRRAFGFRNFENYRLRVRTLCC